MANHDRSVNEVESTSSSPLDLDEVSVLRAEDEDYDEEDLVGEEDERIDEDEEELDEPDDGQHL